jgi:hypothetical protein
VLKLYKYYLKHRKSYLAYQSNKQQQQANVTYIIFSNEIECQNTPLYSLIIDNYKNAIQYDVQVLCILRIVQVIINIWFAETV